MYKPSIKKKKEQLQKYITDIRNPKQNTNKIRIEEPELSTICYRKLRHITRQNILSSIACRCCLLICCYSEPIKTDPCKWWSSWMKMSLSLGFVPFSTLSLFFPFFLPCCHWLTVSLTLVPQITYWPFITSNLKKFVKKKRKNFENIRE